MEKLVWSAGDSKVYSTLDGDTDMQTVAIDLVFARLDEAEIALLEEMIYAWNEAHR